MWIADVFGRERGEKIDLDDIPDLFHRSREMDVLERPDNHIVLGAKGSGKSTALRALTYRAWKQRAPLQNLPFAGVYQPMSFDDVSIFRVAFEERGTTELFEHFLISSIFYQLITQFDGTLPIGMSLEDLLGSITISRESLNSESLARTFLADRFTVLSAMRTNPTTTLLSLRLQAAPLSLSTLQEVAERFALAARRHGEQCPAKLGLLLDSLDYYGLLASTLSPLLQSDSGLPLVVKLAARTLNIQEVFGAAPTRMLERDRDYDVVSLDRNTDDEEHLEVVKDTICRRARRFVPAETRDLTDIDILRLLFDYGHIDPEDLTSFQSFCRLSSGNVLAVILLLDKAAELQRAASATKPDGGQPLTREHRLRAVSELSQEFWDYELGVRVPAQKLEARVFCEAALASARELHPDDIGSPLFRLPVVAPDRSLLVNLLATRVLTASDESVNRRVQSEFEVSSPLDFELNRLLLPRHDRLPRSSPLVVLDRSSFDVMYRRTLKAAKPYLNPRTPREQRELFRQHFRVFISMPFDLSKKERTGILRKSINRLFREKTGEEGGEGSSFMDIHSLPAVGPFRSELPVFIRDAAYVVADITDIGAAPDQTPGVFYEIGVAIGERKPFALFYNARGQKKMPSFSVALLPPVLRGESVLTWDRSGQNFYEKFCGIHEKLIGYNGVWMPNRTGSTDETEAGQRGAYAYLSFQPRNYLAGEWFAAIIKKVFPELGIQFVRPWHADDLGVLVETISRATLCLIDCTGRINEQSLELGLAATTGTKRVVEVWSSELDATVNPVAMFPGQKWAWSDLRENDERYAVNLLRDIARATTLGGRRR